jgi:hypothetical protein
MDGNPPNANRRFASTRIMKSLRDITVCECVRNKGLQFGLSVVYPHDSEKEKTPKMFVALYSEIRTIIHHITSATIRFLQNEIRKSDPTQAPYYYRDSIRMIEKMIQSNNEEGESPDTVLLNSVINRQFYFQQQDVFTYFHINGFTALCSKPDWCGFYSRGNSLDIVELFHILRPIIKQMNTSTYHSIYGGIDEYSVYLIFRICAETPNTRVQGTIIDS